MYNQDIYVVNGRTGRVVQGSGRGRGGDGRGTGRNQQQPFNPIMPYPQNYNIPPNAYQQQQHQPFNYPPNVPQQPPPITSLDGILVVEEY